jgi:hypothetical protein
MKIPADKTIIILLRLKMTPLIKFTIIIHIHSLKLFFKMKLKSQK